MFTLETERLRLAIYQTQQRHDLISLFTDPEVMRHVGQGPLSSSDAEIIWRRLVEEFYPHGKRTIWAVLARDDSRYIGHAALRPRPAKSDEWEISYLLKTAEWRQGFATEIASCLVEFGFRDLKLAEIFATIDDDHTASINVVTKAGMTIRRHEFDELGRYSVYSIKR